MLNKIQSNRTLDGIPITRLDETQRYKYLTKKPRNNASAFQEAWNASCLTVGKTRLLIPNGNYLVSPLMFKGPCKSIMVMKVKGQILASTNLKIYEKNWIEFQYIDGLIISSGGIFNGQGASAWPHNECPKKHKCKVPPIVINSIIRTGDDCISIGSGSKNLRISDVFCGPDHDISIRSLGKQANKKDVVGLTVTDFIFEDIIMNNVYNSIIIDQEYCPFEYCAEKDPSTVKVNNIKFKNIRETSMSDEAIKLICNASHSCEDVQLSDINLKYKGSFEIGNFVFN
ncbi:hypothetical protein Cni_G09679 [Canna indica]|uniref:Uncharacterized protein n=1 Tax=Canna indica TaxID=4628 RepID=A0AAQ3Q6P2_9LILI|nr:hypothetical protein Cni_G09679 [Canna indica]